MIKTITFQNVEYPIRKIDFGSKVIGTEGLNRALMNENGGYISDEARMVDESIFYFVAEESFSLTEKELSLKITNEL